MDLERGVIPIATLAKKKVSTHLAAKTASLGATNGAYSRMSRAGKRRSS